MAEEFRNKYQRNIEVISADLTTDHGIALIENRLQNGDVDVLINNAGYGLNKGFSQSDIKDEIAILKILCEAPMRLAHAVLPSMISRNSGIIINVSSVAAWITGGHYSAMKSYLMVLSESLHTELAETAVKVTSLAPGFTHTEFHQRGKMKMDSLPKSRDVKQIIKDFNEKIHFFSYIRDSAIESGFLAPYALTLGSLLLSILTLNFPTFVFSASMIEAMLLSFPLQKLFDYFAPVMESKLS